jgi:hypothetical protein
MIFIWCARWCRTISASAVCARRMHLACIF